MKKINCRIVIRAFTVRRDLGAAFLLKRALESFGCDVRITSTRDFERVVKYWKPHAIVSNTKNLSVRAKKLSPSSLIFYWPGEGGEREIYSCAKLMDESAYHAYDLLLLWGNEQKGYFKDRYDDADDKTVVCGNPRLDTLKYGKKYIMPKDKTNSIGIVGKYSFLNHHGGLPIAQKLAKSDHHYKNVLRQVVSYRCVIKSIEHIIENSDYNVSIRPYVSEGLVVYDDIIPRKGWVGRVTVDSSTMFADWVAKQNIIISETSTTIIEPYILKTPILNLDHIIANNSKGLAFDWGEHMCHNVSSTPSTYDELVKMLSSDFPTMNNDEELDIYLRDFCNWDEPEGAAKLASNYIVEMMANHKCKSMLHMPEIILDLWDTISCKKALIYNPDHTSFSYYKNLHKEPAYYKDIIHDMFQ